MLEFSLDSREGIALMCLAEALLRIPDARRATADPRQDRRGDWRAHVGRSPSLFVNAAAWGLLVTGKLVDSRSEGALERRSTSLSAQGRRAADPQGRRPRDALLGSSSSLGRTIEEALANAREREARGYRFSFDMLGEAALTDADARAILCATSTRSTRSAAAAGRRRRTTGPASRSSCPRCIRATRDRSATACSRSLRRAWPVSRCSRAATTSVSTSMPRKPTGWIFRSIFSKRWRRIPRSLDGMAWDSSCRRTRSAPAR
jgi:hypothetical protein